MEAVRKRLPKEDIKKLPKENGAWDYLSMWDGLSVLDDRPDTIMILNLDCIVIPHGAQKEVLQLLHVQHMGVARTRKAASVRYYFSGMGAQIAQLVERCQECARFDASKPEEPHIRPEANKEHAPSRGLGLTYSISMARSSWHVWITTAPSSWSRR